VERKTLAVAWKAAATGGSLNGYASTFHNVDRGGDVVVPGAFTDAITEIKASGIPLLADHHASTADVLGTIYDAEEDSTGLRISARFASTQRAQDVRQLLVEGHLSKLSIGYETLAESFEDRDGHRVRLLERIKLWETSVVVFPMNNEAVVTSVKQRSSDLADRLATEELLLRLAMAA
jgi:HK97 family phage prohead protease